MAELRNNLFEIAPQDCAEWLKKTDVVLIPIASCEKHGNHIPMGCDSMNTITTTKRAAKKAEVPHTPLIPVGYSPHHMGRPNEGVGTLTFRASTFRAVCEDIAYSLIYHGFNKLIFVSMHGSNAKINDELLRNIRYKKGALPVWYKAPIENDLDQVRDLLVEDSPELPAGWHSGEMETSLCLAFDEELCHMDRAKEDIAHSPEWLPKEFKKRDGLPTVRYKELESIKFPMEHHEYCESATIGNPHHGSKGQGEELYERTSDALAEFIEVMKKLDWKVEDEKRDWPERAR